MNFVENNIYIQSLFVESNNTDYITAFVVLTEPDSNLLVEVKYFYDTDEDITTNYCKRGKMEIFTDEFEDSEETLLLKEYIEMTRDYGKS